MVIERLKVTPESTVQISVVTFGDLRTTPRTQQNYRAPSTPTEDLTLTRSPEKVREALKAYIYMVPDQRLR